MGRALEGLDDMFTRSVPPELTHALTRLEEQIAQINQQVSALEAKVDKNAQKRQERERVQPVLKKFVYL